MVDTVLRCDPRSLQAPPPAQPSWLASWREADARAAAAIDAMLGDGLSEPNVVRALADALAPDATLLVASSMPVRELESFWPVLASPPRVLANRGANGIDGTISTAFGIAAVSPGPHVRAARRRRARPRHRWPARRAPPRDPADDRPDRQRRRGDLRSPPDRDGEPTSTSSTSRPRRGSISRTPQRSTACPTPTPRRSRSCARRSKLPA